jgi:hypothetical protein
VLAWAVELARADRGVAGAVERARAAWRRIVAPPDHVAAVAATATHQRLAATVVTG